VAARFDSAAALARHVESFWPAGDRRHRFTVLTGGEPLLQVDAALTAELHQRALSDRGGDQWTQKPPGGLDSICVTRPIGCSHSGETSAHFTLDESSLASVLRQRIDQL